MKSQFTVRSVSDYSYWGVLLSGLHSFVVSGFRGLVQLFCCVHLEYACAIFMCLISFQVKKTFHTKRHENTATALLTNGLTVWGRGGTACASASSGVQKAPPSLSLGLPGTVWSCEMRAASPMQTPLPLSVEDQAGSHTSVACIGQTFHRRAGSPSGTCLERQRWDGSMGPWQTGTWYSASALPVVNK